MAETEPLLLLLVPPVLFLIWQVQPSAVKKARGSDPYALDAGKALKIQVSAIYSESRIARVQDGETFDKEEKETNRQRSPADTSVESDIWKKNSSSESCTILTIQANLDFSFVQQKLMRNRFTSLIPFNLDSFLNSPAVLPETGKNKYSSTTKSVWVTSPFVVFSK